MYKFLTSVASQSSPYTPTQKLEKLTADNIIENMGIGLWQAEKINNHRESGKAINNSFYLRKSDTGTILNPYVKTSYNVVQYDAGVRWMDYFVQEGFVTYDSALYLDHTDFAVTSITPYADTVIEGDSVETYLVLAVGHGPHRKHKAMFTTIRPICGNTLSAALLCDGLDIKNLQLAKNAMLATFQRNMALYKRLAGQTITPKDVSLVFETVSGMYGKEEEEITPLMRKTMDAMEEAYISSPGMAMFGRDNTAWRAYNAVTFTAGSLGKTDIASYKRLQAVGNKFRRTALQTLSNL